jgi:hypothetical protein
MATSEVIKDSLRANLQRTSEVLQLQVEQYASIGSQFKTIFFYESQPTSMIDGGSVMVSYSPLLFAPP